jgi:transcriptional regulator with XRE-family HTH domain
MSQNFAEFLKAELKRRGINATDLPRRTGLKPGSVSYLLSGKRAPDEKTLAALAEGLELPLAYLLERAGYATQAPSLSPAQERLIAVIQYGSEAQALLLLDLLDHFFARYEVGLKRHTPVKRQLAALLADLPDEDAQVAFDLLKPQHT